MTHHERRAIEIKIKCDAGDRRALLLANTPPSERSETAACYDHRREAEELDQRNTPTQDELESLKISLWRAAVAITLADSAQYRDIVTRYMGGHRVSAGMARSITQAESVTPFPSTIDVLTAWTDSRRFRREYLGQRYGV